MSRSYKKTPYCGDKKGKAKKRIANHRVRQSLKRDLELVVQKGQYKRLFETWDICDYYSIQSWESYWRSSVNVYYWIKERFPESTKNKFPDKKEEYRKWKRYYKNK